MARNLTTGLQRGLRRSLRPGLGGGDLFTTASLDLNFARYKTLDSRITFTRASSGTYVDSQGVIRTATTNLLLRSEEFDNASWVKTLATVTANVTTAPNGSVAADKLIGNSTIDSHYAQQNISGATNGISYTSSVYAKASEITRIEILHAVGATLYVQGYDLSSGTLLTRVTAGTTAATGGFIQAVGNGWYRCGITQTSDGTTGAVRVTLRSANTVNFDATSQGVLLWGAQLEQSSTVGEYIPTTSTINSAPRFDHSPTTGESLGLLVEEQRTNSVTNNTMVGAVAGTPGTIPTSWGAYVSPTGLTRTIVGSGTINGINYIDVRFNGTPSSTGEITLYLSPATTATLAQAWTSSVWLSLVGGSLSNIAAINLRNFEINSGAYVRESNANFVSSISSDLVRRQLITTSFGAGANQIQLVLSLFATAGGTPIDITLRIGMPQLEQGAFPTSVIPTTTAAVTRSADVASITGSNFSSWYRQDEGTVFANWSYPVTPSSFPRIWGFTEGAAGSANSFSISTNFVNHNRFGAIAQNVVLFDSQQGPDATINTPMRSAMALKSGSIGYVGNGVTPTNNSGSMPSGIDRCYIGSLNGGLFLTGTIRRLCYWSQRLPNSTLQQITQ